MKIRLACSCRELFHELEVDKVTYDYLHEIIVNKGEYKKVIHLPSGECYRVPMGYIMVHGLKGFDLPYLGFPKWKDKKTIN